MNKEFIPYELALELKQLGFDNFSFGRFYTKPSCKMFSIDEKGRHYPIKNTPKKLYTTGEHFVLKDENIIIAPTYAQCFRFFREKYDIHYSIDRECSQHDHKWGYNWSLYNYTGIFDEYLTSHPDAPAGEWVYQTYEEAERECLKKLIEIVKEKQNGRNS